MILFIAKIYTSILRWLIDGRDICMQKVFITRNYIKNELKIFSLKVLNSESITWESMQEFRSLHIAEAGKETRLEDSWRRQYEIVQANEAFVIISRFDNEIISAGLFSFNQINYYWGSVSRRKLFEKPLFHAIMWSAILHAKKLGLCWFEMGVQLYYSHLNDNNPTDKELGISTFKAGFSGNKKSVIRCEVL
jgi:lipid II:glycine glycyltransferase (peptidoglycan interpeptide bridge formation enzyme)